MGSSHLLMYLLSSIPLRKVFTTQDVTKVRVEKAEDRKIVKS